MNHIISTSTGKRRVAIAAILGLTLLSGVVHGYLDGRWSSETDLVAQGDRLQQLPQQSGDWVLTGTSELDDEVASMLRCYGSVMRDYRNVKTEERITVAVMFGPRGPIAVHTPEVCYRSVGTTQTRTRQVESIPTVTHGHELWSVEFTSEQAGAPFEVWYAWTDDVRWQASERPRFWLTDNLYKIQIAGPVGDETRRPCREFLQAFLPDLEKTAMN